MAVVPGTQYNPVPPMTIEGCRYQVQIDRNEHTYKCYTEQEYQTMLQQQEAQVQKLQQEMDNWLGHNWGWIVLVAAVLVLWAIFKSIKFEDDSYDRFMP